MMFVHLTPKSGNRKVGPIPVSTTEERSCPAECALRGTDCYARFGPLGMHWRKVGNGRGDNFTGFCHRVRRFPNGQVWRHNQAGDLPQRKDGKINRFKLRQLSLASQKTKGWTYTHYDPTDKNNRKAIKETNDRGGLTINLSADSLDQADQYADLNIGPVAVTLPSDATQGCRTPQGRIVVICPAITQDDVTCESCQLCRHAHRQAIVGFPAHGTASKRLSKKLQENT